MRKLILTTAAVAGTFAGEPSFGTLTDTRDGQTYKTVKIGTQTWMAQNLNYQTDSSWCYNNADSNCVKYGRLYDWDAATTACPTGWKLPDTVDWNKLVMTAGGERTAGKKLKSKYEWRCKESYNGSGTDDFKISALPGGERSSYRNCEFRNLINKGSWWTTTEMYGRNAAYCKFILSCNNVVTSWPLDKAYYALSVRCVADSP
ncbi:MAG: fibrobacter succinogenes major paralogous domain-containing protein [Chitinispirillales bacterium]|jgi:uncharacterized protein (TIGR02145 family)|nr:fibrobacter succinogenes major paralogous domain-containing protein [Chitinispirillales bacterium]